MTDNEWQELMDEIYKRTYQKKMECLFEEPCPLYEDEEE